MLDSRNYPQDAKDAFTNLSKKIGAQTNLVERLKREVRAATATRKSYIKALIVRLSTGKEASWEPDPKNQSSDFT